MLLIMTVLGILSALSPEIQEQVESIDSLAARVDPYLQTRVFMVTNHVIPGIGYDTCELTVGEEAITDLVDDVLVVVEHLKWLKCRFTHAGLTVTSEFFLDEREEPVLCISSWDNGDGEPPLFMDRFYFMDGETLACAYGDGEIMEPSEENLRRGDHRLAHAAQLLEASRTMTLPAPPMFGERVEEAYGVE